MQAKVVLPLAIQEELYYRVPHVFENTIQIGMRALVALGKRKYYVGIVTEVVEGEEEPSEKSYQLKEILALPDNSPSVSAEELAFWQFLAYYYIAPLGDVLSAALPSALLPTNTTPVRINGQLLEALSHLSPTEELFREVLLNHKQDTLSFEEFVDKVGKRAVPFFDKLLANDVFTLDNSALLRPSQTGVEFVGLGEAYRNEKALTSLIEELQKTPARQALLIRLLALLNKAETGPEEIDYSLTIPLDTLFDGDPNRRNAWKNLIARYPDLFEIAIKPKPLACIVGKERESPPQKSHVSEKCYLESDKPTLFLAEDYKQQFAFIAQHIKAVMAEGKRVLLLLPQSSGPEGDEIFVRPLLGLTDTPILLLTGHSTQKERIELRRRLRETHEPMLIVGSRTAAFIPSEKLGLIVIAEEQDPYYKQQDPSPRFHARDALVFRAQKMGIPIILTAVTPSLESLHNAEKGKYTLVNFSKDTCIPAPLLLVDSKKEREIRRLRYGHILSKELRLRIKETLSKGHKVLVLASRKGFAPSLHCFACGESIQCSRCDVTLTYHRYQEKLICSYCGFCTDVPKECPTCLCRGNAEEGSLKKMGFGSERVENELQEAFPQSRILRIDGETSRTKGNRNTLKEALLEGTATIYVGTSLITRLNSLGDIQLIAVPQLDLLLSFPDFRNDEQIFASLTGLIRRYPKATLLLQMHDLQHPIVKRLERRNYKEIADDLLQEREFFHFPPFERLIRIVVKASKSLEVEQAATDLATKLRAEKHCFADVDGPIEPFVSKIRLQYIRHITLRLVPEANSKEVRAVLQSSVGWLRKNILGFRRSRIYFDVDPY